MFESVCVWCVCVYKMLSMMHLKVCLYHEPCREDLAIHLETAAQGKHAHNNTHTERVRLLAVPV